MSICTVATDAGPPTRHAEGMDIPWRGPADPPLDVARLPLFRGLRPLQKWRYLGVYGPEVPMLATASTPGQ